MSRAVIPQPEEIALDATKTSRRDRWGRYGTLPCATRVKFNLFHIVPYFLRGISLMNARGSL